LPELAGDGPRLVQVLVNLVGNAHKYAPPGSVIRVGGEVGPSEVVLWVDDEGPGLPVGDEEALFERFFRAETGETDTAGLGLGLAIARSIVERHGGRIQASPRPRGARFAFSLPRPERGVEA
jgi:two-component system, OmpR family, sensor histidine kinase KdpD